jgi:hypothetical protein
MTNRNCLALLAAAVTALACSHDTTQPSIRPGPADVTGSWTENLGVTIPGVEFLLVLRDSASVVSGTGTWENEAGPSGSLVARGTAITDSIHLQIIYVPNPVFVGTQPDTAQLEAVLTTRDRIDGTLHREGLPPSTIQLVRVKASDVPGG